MTYFGNQKHGPLSARDKMASDGAWLAGLGYVKTRSPITVFRNRSKNMTLFDSFLRSVVHHSQSQRFLWWGCSCVGLTFGSRCRLCSCASNRGARCRYTRARDSFSLDALITRNELNHRMSLQEYRFSLRHGPIPSRPVVRVERVSVCTVI